MQEDAPLSQFNESAILCFKDFIKYNPKLIHLNLERCGLKAAAIKIITAMLRKSQALRCLHLCGNLGLSHEVIEWIRYRIHARQAHGDNRIEPL